jgi:tRNA A37 threonylcarbamoyladenosine synthetase subunit TsaC/SUA5/YrdC
MTLAVRPDRETGWTQGDVEDAYRVIRGGGLALIKGDIGYGLVGHSAESIRKMYRLKGRPEWNRCITLGNLAVVQEISALQDHRILGWLRAMMEETTISIVSYVNPSSRLLASLPELTYQQATVDGTVACFLRTGAFPEALVARALADDFLLVASSANLAFKGNNYRLDEIPKEMLDQVDYKLDLGVARYENPQRLATTIVDITKWTLRRRGVNADMIEASMRDLARAVGPVERPRPNGEQTVKEG